MAAKRLEVVKRHLTGHPVLGTTSAALVSGKKFALTQDDLDFYDRNGFIVVKGLYERSELEEYRQRFQEICHSQERPPFMTIMKDVSSLSDGRSEYTVNKIQDFQLDSVLSQYCSNPGVLDIVEALIGRDIMAMHTMLINKPPDTGNQTSRHPHHQDLWYFPFRPPDKIVCSWTAMEWVHRGNGCLVVFPGTHKGELLKHSYPQWQGGVNKMYHGIERMPGGIEPTYLEMEAGDTVFFHPLLIHGSGANKTKGFRKAISCHFASGHCEYVDVEGTLQEEVAKEVEAAAKKRLKGTEIKFEDVWKLKGLLVRGERVNL